MRRHPAPARGARDERGARPAGRSPAARPATSARAKRPAWRRVRGRVQEHRLQRGLRRLVRGEGHPLARARTGRSPRSTAPRSSAARASTRSSPRSRARSWAIDTWCCTRRHRASARRVQLGVAPDADVGRGGAARLPGGRRGAGGRSAGARPRWGEPAGRRRPVEHLTATRRLSTTDRTRALRARRPGRHPRDVRLRRRAGGGRGRHGPRAGPRRPDRRRPGRRAGP